MVGLRQEPENSLGLPVIIYPRQTVFGTWLIKNKTMSKVQR